MLRWLPVSILSIVLLVAGSLLAYLVACSGRFGNQPIASPTSRLPSLVDPTAAATTLATTGPIATLRSTANASQATIDLPTSTWQPSPVPSEKELGAMVAQMSLQDKVAQMVMIGFDGQSVTTSPQLKTMVGTYHVGGVVLLEANAHDPKQISSLTSQLQSLGATSGARIPLFIAINHEGGPVVRITEGATAFPGNMAVAATGKSEYAYIAAALGAQELRAIGVNMNLAPVLDVNDNPLNPIIGVRSFGEDPTLVAKYGQLAVKGSQDNGVIAVAKHFPGHGSVEVDSHVGLPVQRASVDRLMQHELVPFEAAIRQGVAGIMTAHIAVPALDKSNRPATLSSQVLTGLLRQKMGYNGLIMTDSLGMSGVSAGRGQARAAVEAVQAGADVVLSTSPMDAHVAMIQALVAAVRSGEISVEQVDRSVMRILHVKHTFGLFQTAAVAGLKDADQSIHQAIADEIASQAVTLLRDDSGRIPLRPPPGRLLLVSPSDLPPGVSHNGTLFAELLRGKGYDVNELVYNLDTSGNRDLVYARAVSLAPSYDVAVFGEWELIKRYMNLGDKWQEEFIAKLNRSGSPLVVVAWHNPAAIIRLSQVSTFVTAYGDTRAQVAAIVDVLTGKRVPTGHLPMTVQ